MPISGISLHRTQLVLFISVFALVFNISSAVLLVLHRHIRRFTILGPSLLFFSFLACGIQAVIGIQIALWYGEADSSQCKIQFVLVTLTLPLSAMPALLTAVRLLTYINLEKCKSSLIGPGAQEAIQNQQKLRDRLNRSTTSIAFVALSLLPAFVVIFMQAKKGLWVVKGDTTNSVQCASRPAGILASFYALTYVLACAWLYVQLKAARENFGIKSTYSRTLSSVGVLVAVWLALAAQPAVEGIIPAVLGSLAWPFFALYVPLFQEYRGWTPENALLIDGKTRQPVFIRGHRSNSDRFGRTSRSASMRSLGQMEEVTLATVMGDPKMLEDFSRFLKAEFSVENLLFLQAVQGYRAAPSREDALALIALYVLDSAPLQVNVSNTARTRLVEFAKSGRESAVVLLRPPGTDVEMAALTEQDEADLFGEAEAEISHLLEFDSLRRFLKTKQDI
eukprot:TRINITY_DN527_c0_g1_i2.p1 TRINITY_DN527_c0_g1~~TRINITY_DN527_c0_g1_i2.p1  ORF type:complete len:450 (-),score=88.96 TRINITY_DN527_c0_g1_i2:45-1394(-)